MPIEQAIQEMEGKISLLDNQRFIRMIGVIGFYYIIWLGFLAYTILCA